MAPSDVIPTCPLNHPHQARTHPLPDPVDPNPTDCPPSPYVSPTPTPIHKDKKTLSTKKSFILRLKRY